MFLIAIFLKIGLFSYGAMIFPVLYKGPFLFFIAPLYAFTVWIAGCLIIGLFWLIFRRWIE